MAQGQMPREYAEEALGTQNAGSGGQDPPPEATLNLKKLEAITP